MSKIIPFPRRVDPPCDSEPAYQIGVYAPPPVHISWWSRLSPGQKVDLVLGATVAGILIAALMMIPG